MAVYLVTLGDSEHLVEAKSEAQAVRHVTRQLVECRLATVEDGARVGAAGGKLEKAGQANVEPVASSNEAGVAE